MTSKRTIIAAATAALALGALLGLRAFLPVDSALGRLADESELPVAGEFSVQMLDGQRLSSDDVRGQVLILDFWATWCGPCLTEIDDFNELAARYGDRALVLGVTMQSGDAAEVAAFARDQGIEYPLAVGDDTIFRDFGSMWGYPTTYLIDTDWRVRKVWVGAGPAKHAQLRELLDELVAAE